MTTEKTNQDNGQGNVHGEGNYKASREYNEATKKFVESGKVDQAAQQAAPANAQEARELEQAERAGKAPAREEEPGLKNLSKAGKKK